MQEKEKHDEKFLYDVVFFSAHPDDAEFMVGDTLLKLARKYKVANIILTRGEAGTCGTPEERVAESKKASEYGGYDVEFLDFRDNFVEDNVENAHKLADVIRKYKPKVVFSTYHTHYSFHLDGVSHPDHSATGRLVLKAARYAKFKNAKLDGQPHCVKRLMYYMLPRKAMPSFVVDVSDVVGKLDGLWSCHKSQFENLAQGKLKEKLISYRQTFGHLINLDYAEGFTIEEPVKADVDWILDL